MAKTSSFRNQFEISSGPGDLWVFTWNNKLYTSFDLKVHSLGTSVVSGTDKLESGARSIDTCNNALLIRSASN